MTKVAGDQWRATIPAASDANVWYFIVARTPRGTSTATPSRGPAPTSTTSGRRTTARRSRTRPAIAGTVSGANVTLTWTPPTTNATPAGSAYTDAGGYKVYRNRNDGTGWALHYVTGPINEPAGDTSFVDGRCTTSTAYRYEYHVTAFDLCSPTPNESDALERLHRDRREQLRQHAERRR